MFNNIHNWILVPGKNPLHCLIYQHECSLGIWNVDVGKAPTEFHRNVTEMDKSRREIQKGSWFSAGTEPKPVTNHSLIWDIDPLWIQPADLTRSLCGPAVISLLGFFSVEVGVWRRCRRCLGLSLTWSQDVVGHKSRSRSTKMFSFIQFMYNKWCKAWAVKFLWSGKN